MTVSESVEPPPRWPRNSENISTKSQKVTGWLQEHFQVTCLRVQLNQSLRNGNRAVHLTRALSSKAGWVCKRVKETYNNSKGFQASLAQIAKITHTTVGRVFVTWQKSHMIPLLEFSRRGVGDWSQLDFEFHVRLMHVESLHYILELFDSICIK